MYQLGDKLAKLHDRMVAVHGESGVRDILRRNQMIMLANKCRDLRPEPAGQFEAFAKAVNDDFKKGFTRD